MTRTLNSSVAQQRHEYAYLYEFEFSGGTLRFTNASFDIDYGGNTYSAVGGLLQHDQISETQDRRAQGVDVKLSGVDQTVISAILTNNFRGREARIWLIHIDPDTGTHETPDLVWRGRMNGEFQIEEDRDEDGEAHSVTVSTRIVSAMAMLNTVRSVRTNVASHEEMLRRAGQASPTDTFFSRIQTLAGKQVYWGQEAPEESSKHGGQTGGDGGGRGGDEREFTDE